MKRYQAIANVLAALKNCQANGNAEWEEKHGERLHAIMCSAPSGSGIDRGTKLEDNSCTPERLVFSCSYHHMNENGMYNGWTEHSLTVTPSLVYGIKIKISGRNRNEIKDYLHEVYADWLNADETI